MMELKVVLDFHCCKCQHPVGVTVKCEGKGLQSGMRSVAAVAVPCPTCGSVNQLMFEPNGTIRGVKPYNTPRKNFEPSIN